MKKAPHPENAGPYVSAGDQANGRLPDGKRLRAQPIWTQVPLEPGSEPCIGGAACCGWGDAEFAEDPPDEGDTAFGGRM